MRAQARVEAMHTNQRHIMVWDNMLFTAVRVDNAPCNGNPAKNT